uniref:Gamma-glutamylcyclotransferase family protein n=1 Tax=Panagrolaimus sp. JU765 TaxID=591449 RepID=A0AC34R2A4_9BILA
MDNYPHTLFVYGTLKSGEPNEHVMKNSNTGKHLFLGDAQMIDKYPLIVASKYNIPFLLNQQGEGYQIHGELYQVDDEKLIALDALEGYPEFYTREIHQFRTDKGEIVSAWIYMLREYDPRLDSTRTKLLARYTNGVEGRYYNIHENCESVNDLF